MSDNRKDTDGLNAPDLPSLADNRWPVLEKGWVWLVGGGPGDPGLLTLHALNALKQAEVIIYDALVDEHILQWANPGQSLNMPAREGENHHRCSVIFPCA